MECIYINLASAIDRRNTIETNFQACMKPDWTLSRFAAIDADYVKNQNILGRAKPAEKACLLSHKTLIGSKMADGKTFFILEDDATFGVRTCNLVDMILHRNQNLDWDILFTDVCIPEMTTMFELLKYRRNLGAEKIEIAVMDLSETVFAGSTAYLVNAKSRQKIYDLLDAVREIDIPYDLYLRHLIHSSALKGFSLFPFVTSLSDFSEASQIRSMDITTLDITWNMFRKMIWVERDLEACKATLQMFKEKLLDHDVAAVADEELNAFLTLFASMAAISP
jgi:GR25 family glycosyltransferase involved in LPS biosynthesis